MPTRSWQDLLNDAGETGNYDPLPEGDYDFAIKQAEVKQAQSGRTMYVIKASVEGGPFNGKTVWHNFVLTPENPTALGWFFRNMGTLGLGQEYFKSNPSDHHVAEALVGRKFRGQITIRKWQGQDKNEIRGFFPPSGQGAPPAPPTTAPHAAPQPPSAPAAPPPPPAAPAPPPAVQPVAPAPVAEAAPAPAPVVAPAPAPDPVPDPVAAAPAPAAPPAAAAPAADAAATHQEAATQQAPTPPPLSAPEAPAQAPAAPAPAPEPAMAGSALPPPPPF